MFFVLGLFAGIFVFGETIDNWLSGFWNSSYMGRFTLPEMFGLPIGVVVAAIIIMAVFLFWLVEKTETWMTGAAPQTGPRRTKVAGAVALIAVAVAVMIIGQPTPTDKWQQMAAEKQPLLDNREVYIHPAELLEYIYNDRVTTVMLDVRPESDYNLFHVGDAQLVAPDKLPALAQLLREKPANTLFVVMSNDEIAATAAWKTLVAESVANVYILEGGVNNWLDTFNIQPEGVTEVAVAMLPTPVPTAQPGSDMLRYRFPAALGAQYPAAYPEPHEFEDIEFVPKVKLEMKAATGGG
ncbi:MAG: hypothetical protein FOGNACKC_03844 [Anaerolineae bacterium]|nr:hypothetical protein [Anaerolineae bacterium]